MIGAKGFRAREATANYKRRIRKLASDEVRAARFANLHGNAEPTPAVEPEAVEPAAEVEVTVETQPEQTEAPADEAADEAGDEDAAADEEAGEGEAEEPAADGETAPKKKAAKAKKKAGK